MAQGRRFEFVVTDDPSAGARLRGELKQWLHLAAAIGAMVYEIVSAVTEAFVQRGSASRRPRQWTGRCREPGAALALARRDPQPCPNGRVEPVCRPCRARARRPLRQRPSGGRRNWNSLLPPAVRSALFAEHSGPHLRPGLPTPKPGMRGRIPGMSRRHALAANTFSR
jgi:hypothetical protein